MKKIHSWLAIVCLLCCSVISYGTAPWGALNDFDQPLNPDQASPAQKGERYLLPQILRGEPVRIFADVSKTEQKSPKEYQALLSQLYNEWFLSVAEIIENAGREKEFADVLPLLKKGVKTQFVGKEESPDIIITILPYYESVYQCNGATVCYLQGGYTEDRIPRIFLPEGNLLKNIFTLGKKSFKRVGLHEMGHSLGLSDQYSLARNQQAHGRYSSNRIYNGLMNQGLHISCDEADGLVNLIDIVRGSSRGGGKGWKSLCAESEERYINGQSTARSGPYWISTRDNQNFQLETYQNGKTTSIQHYFLLSQDKFLPLVRVQEKVLKRDVRNRPVLTEGPNGEKIYYAYLYEGYVRLAVKEGKALWSEERTSFYSMASSVKDVRWSFKKDGVATTLRLIQKGNQFLVSYKEHPLLGKRTFSLNMLLNRKGEILFFTWDENDQRLFSEQLASGKLKPAQQTGQAVSPQEQAAQLARVRQKAQIQEQLLRWSRQVINLR